MRARPSVHAPDASSRCVRACTHTHACMHAGGDQQKVGLSRIPRARAQPHIHIHTHAHIHTHPHTQLPTHACMHACGNQPKVAPSSIPHAHARTHTLTHSYLVAKGGGSMTPMHITTPLDERAMHSVRRPQVLCARLQARRTLLRPGTCPRCPPSAIHPSPRLPFSSITTYHMVLAGHLCNRLARAAVAPLIRHLAPQPTPLGAAGAAALRGKCSRHDRGDV